MSKRRLFCHVLLYHAVFEIVPDTINTHFHNVRPDELHRQLAWMKEHFDFVTVDDLLGLSDREGVCAVTFDDAYKSVFENAVPVLEDLGIPATVYVIGSTLHDNVFWRDKIRFIIRQNLVESFLAYAPTFFNERCIDANNFYKATKNSKANTLELIGLIDDFLYRYNGENAKDLNFCADTQTQLIEHELLTYGNHTYRHAVFSSLNNSEIKEEITANAAILKCLESSPSRVFSIPFGGTSTFDDTTLRLIGESDYDAVLLSRTRANHVTQGKLPEINGMPFIERYMAKGQLPEFQQDVADVIADAEALVN